jgi:hypothetical protein
MKEVLPLLSTYRGRSTFDNRFRLEPVTFADPRGFAGRRPTGLVIAHELVADAKALG